MLEAKLVALACNQSHRRQEEEPFLMGGEGRYYAVELVGAELLQDRKGFILPGDYYIADRAQSP